MADIFRKEYRELTREDKEAMHQVKSKADDLNNFLLTLTPTRETSIAKTKLEEAVMWAVKSITG
jgi:hypothetical protein